MSTQKLVWATVTQVDPLRIVLDGDQSPLQVTPDCLIDPVSLVVGQRVRCDLSDRHLVVHGASGGGGGDLHVAGLEVSGAVSVGSLMVGGRVVPDPTPYSLDEIDTGTRWVDGRVVYRKVVQGTVNLVGGSSANIAHGITGITSSFVVISATGSIKIGQSSGSASAGVNMFWYQESGGHGVPLNGIDSTNIGFAPTFSWGASWVSVVIEYVK